MDKNFYFSMPYDLWVQLREQAVYERKSSAEVIRNAVELYLRDMKRLNKGGSDADISGPQD